MPRATISIDPCHLFLGNQARKTAIIVRMGRDSQSKSLCGGVSDKQFFTSNANALTTVRGVDLGGVRLEPRPVAFKALVLRPSLVQLNGIAHLFHGNCGLLNSHMTELLHKASRRGTSILGRVDELFDDNPHGDEMNQSQKGLTQFLIPRGNAPKLLEVVEEPFHLLTQLVEVFIIV
jgi:hypothetical protein